MLILAIDTALGACSAGVFDTERGAMLAAESMPMERGHAEALAPLLHRVMRAARLDFSALDRIAVTVGPGSFTGLRVGVAAARGIALSAAKPAVGITTLRAYAAPHADDDRAPLLAAIDARHDHVYAQMFGTAGRPAGPPRIASVAEAVAMAIGGPARIVGNAARLIEAAWPSGAEPATLIEQSAAPEIAWVARLGAAASVEQALPKPLYLRAPDAQPQFAARLARR